MTSSSAHLKHGTVMQLLHHCLAPILRQLAAWKSFRQSRRLQRLVERNAKLRRAGNFAEVDKLWEEMGELLLEGGSQEEDEALALYAMALSHEDDGDWDAAERVYLELLSQAGDRGFGRYMECCNLASFYFLIGRSVDGFKYRELAVEAARLSGSELTLAMALNDKAAACWALDPQSLMPLADEILQLTADFEAGNVLRADAYLHRAKYHLSQNNLSAARDDAATAYCILQPMNCIQSAGGVQGASTTYHRLSAEIALAEGDHSTAVNSMSAAVAACRRVSEMEHCAGVYSRRSLGSILEQLARVHEAVGDTHAARVARDEAVAIIAELRLPT